MSLSGLRLQASGPARCSRAGSSRPCPLVGTAADGFSSYASLTVATSRKIRAEGQRSRFYQITTSCSSRRRVSRRFPVSRAPSTSAWGRRALTPRFRWTRHERGRRGALHLDSAAVRAEDAVSPDAAQTLFELKQRDGIVAGKLRDLVPRDYRDGESRPRDCGADLRSVRLQLRRACHALTSAAYVGGRQLLLPADAVSPLGPKRGRLKARGGGHCRSPPNRRSRRGAVAPMGAGCTRLAAREPTMRGRLVNVSRTPRRGYVVGAMLQAQGCSRTALNPSKEIRRPNA